MLLDKPSDKFPSVYKLDLIQRWVYNRNMDKKKIDYIITCAKHGEERTSKRCEPWVRFGYKSKEEYEQARKQAIPLW